MNKDDKTRERAVLVFTTLLYTFAGIHPDYVLHGSCAKLNHKQATRVPRRSENLREQNVPSVHATHTITIGLGNSDG